MHEIGFNNGVLPQRAEPALASRRARGGLETRRAPVALIAVSVLLTSFGWTSVARASSEDACVRVDEARDGLSESDRRAARMLFEEALSDAGQSVGSAACRTTWTLYHVRLGESITVVVRGPAGSRRRRVAAVEELPAAYSQMTRGLLSGAPSTNDSAVIDRTNALDSQSEPARVRADHVWYLRLGYGAGGGDELRSGPQFGFGHRWELDRFALDVSFLSFQILEHEDARDADDGISGELLALSGQYFFSPSSNHSPYVGVGVGLGGQSLPDNHDGSGLHGKLMAGYEMFRASSLRMMVQLDFVLPFYRTRNEGVEPTDDRFYVPTVGLSLGGGWSR